MMGHNKIDVLNMNMLLIPYHLKIIMLLIPYHFQVVWDSTLFPSGVELIKWRK